MAGPTHNDHYDAAKKAIDVANSILSDPQGGDRKLDNAMVVAQIATAEALLAATHEIYSFKVRSS